MSALGEIEGGAQSKVYPLDWSRVRPLVSSEFGVASWTADPVGPEVLEGQWYAENLGCDDEVAGQTIEITRDGESLTATKTLGDTCVETGEESWTGTFAEGRIDGVLNLASGDSSTPVIHDPGTPPAFPNPDAPLEGGWVVEWRGTPRGTLTGYANLSFDDAWQHQAWFDQPTAEFRRTDTAIPDSLIVSSTGLTYESHADHLCFPLGDDICDYERRWRSTLTAVSPDELRGQWSAGGSSGAEVWRRLDVPEPREAQGSRPSGFSTTSGVSDTASFGERPLRFVLDPNQGFAQQLLYIDIVGDDLWGPHSVWMVPNTNIELIQYPGIRGLYKCASDAIPDWSPNNVLLCADENATVTGFRIPLKVRRDAAPGLYSVFFDGRWVQFTIEWEKPQRPMLLAVRSCSVMEELDGPEPVLTFRRSQFPS